MSALTFALLEEPLDSCPHHLSAREIRASRKQQEEMRDAYFDVLGHSMIIIPSSVLHSRYLALAVFTIVVFLTKTHYQRWHTTTDSVGILRSSCIAGVLRLLVVTCITTCLNGIFACKLQPPYACQDAEVVASYTEKI